MIDITGLKKWAAETDDYKALFDLWSELEASFCKRDSGVAELTVDISISI